MEDVLKVNSFVQVNFLKEKLEDFSQTVPKLFKKIAFFLFCVRNRNFAQSLKTFLSTCVFTFSTFRISGVNGNINDKVLFFFFINGVKKNKKGGGIILFI